MFSHYSTIISTKNKAFISTSQIFIWDWDLNLGRKEFRSPCLEADGTIKTLVLTTNWLTETMGATLRNKMFWPFADFGSESHFYDSIVDIYLRWPTGYLHLDEITRWSLLWYTARSFCPPARKDEAILLKVWLKKLAISELKISKRTKNFDQECSLVGHHTYPE